MIKSVAVSMTFFSVTAFVYPGSKVCQYTQQHDPRSSEHHGRRKCTRGKRGMMQSYPPCNKPFAPCPPPPTPSPPISPRPVLVAFSEVSKFRD